MSRGISAQQREMLAIIYDRPCEPYQLRDCYEMAGGYDFLDDNEIRRLIKRGLKSLAKRGYVTIGYVQRYVSGRGFVSNMQATITPAGEEYIRPYVEQCKREYEEWQKSPAAARLAEKMAAIMAARSA